MKLKYAALAAMILVGFNAEAAQVTLSNVAAEWFDATNDPSGLKYENSTTGAQLSRVSWGTPIKGSNSQSSYDFQPSTASSLESALDESFVIGTFAHNNFPITAKGGNIRTVKLKVSFDLAIRDDSGSKDFGSLSSVYNFHHLETVNSPSNGICLAGGEAPCPDLVTISNNIVQTEKFDLNGTTYSLFVSGFDAFGTGEDGKDEFLTLEKASNFAKLRAIVTVEDPLAPVPAPAALPLMLTALGGIGFLSARRKA